MEMELENHEAPIACTPVFLPEHLRLESARRAIEIFPCNAPPSNVTAPERIAVLTQKFWGKDGVDLTVGFMEPAAVALRERILSHANAWGAFAKVRFRWTQTSPQIRISRGQGGYWSYLGVDCLSIPRNAQTMNLEAFTMSTPESEFVRVVRHEFGHTLGCPHEQQRREILALLDEAKVIAYFEQTQGWDEQEVRQQILVPLEDHSLTGASPADQASIMCYQFPGSITKNGRPIPGGLDFSTTDREFMGKIYPVASPPPPPPPPPGGQLAATVSVDPATEVWSVQPQGRHAEATVVTPEHLVGKGIPQDLASQVASLLALADAKPLAVTSATDPVTDPLSLNFFVHAILVGTPPITLGPMLEAASVALCNALVTLPAVVTVLWRHNCHGDIQVYLGAVNGKKAGG